MAQTSPNQTLQRKNPLIVNSFSFPIWLAFAAGLVNLLAFEVPRRLSSSHDWTKDYGITEWLINFQSGFIRRGAIGEVFYFLWKQAKLNPIQVSIVLSLFLYSILFVWLLIRAQGLVSAWLLPSSIFLGHPVFVDNIVRKDILLILLLVVLVVVGKRVKSRAFRVAFVNLLLCFGMLVHEMFFLIALPCALWLERSSVTYRSYKSGWNITRAVFTLAPAFFLFFFLAIKTSAGNPNSAVLIHNSWASLWNNPDSLFPQAPGGSIMWIGANSTQTLKLVFDNNIRPYFGVPSFVWLSVTILVSAIIALAGMSRQLALLFSRWFVVQFLSIGPLFAIAVDSGRWIFLIFASSLVLSIEGVRSKDEPLLQRNHFMVFVSSLLIKARIQAVKTHQWIIPALLIFWGIPGPEWTPFDVVLSSPVYGIWQLVRNLDLLPSMKSLINA